MTNARYVEFCQRRFQIDRESSPARCEPNVAVTQYFRLRALGTPAEQIKTYSPDVFNVAIFVAGISDVTTRFRNYRALREEEENFAYELACACTELASSRSPGSWILRRSSRQRQVGTTTPTLRERKHKALLRAQIQCYALSRVCPDRRISHTRFVFVPGCGWRKVKDVNVVFGENGRVDFEFLSFEMDDPIWEPSFVRFLEGLLTEARLLFDGQIPLSGYTQV
jgi:hypothetical protein